MINITNKKENYKPIQVVGNGILISFGYKDTIIKDADGNNVTTGLGTWTEHIFPNRRTVSQIKTFILDELNRRIDHKILSGFKWRDMEVWLSTENQFNYKAAYDLAVQTGGANLPVTFKFGTTDEPVYHTFTTLEEINSFYLSAMKYITDTLAEGWKEKDAIDWNAYTL